MEGYNETCHLATKATESTDPDHVSGCSISQYNQKIYEKNGVIYSDNTQLVRNPDNITSFYGPENANVTYTVPAIKHYTGYPP